MIQGKARKPSIELVPVFNVRSHVAGIRDSDLGAGSIDPPSRVPSCLRKCGANGDPVRPRQEAIWIPKLWQLSPHFDERLLHGVCGEIGVADNVVRDGMETVTYLRRNRREGRFFSTLGALDELPVHAPPSANRRAPASANADPEDATPSSHAQVCQDLGSIPDSCHAGVVIARIGMPCDQLPTYRSVNSPFPIQYHWSKFHSPVPGSRPFEKAT